MIILTFKKHSEYKLGVRQAEGVLDIASGAKALGANSIPLNITALMQGGLDALERLHEFVDHCKQQSNVGDWLLKEDDLSIGPCVSGDGKIICVGLNYRRHADEAGLPVPDTPILFSKYSNSLAITDEEIPLPGVATQYDYEAELVVIIGKSGKYIPKEEALSYVMGYANGNDISARDLQVRTSQWLLGKTLDKFMPIGPYLVTHHDIPDPQALSIRCWLNDVLRQDSSTKDMIFNVAEIVHYASQHFTLLPGDIITTGTPEGVIFGDAEPAWMKPGDRVVVEIEGLGRLVNTMTHDPAELT